MSKFVLDASVAIKWCLPEVDSPKAQALRDEYRQQIHELIAPDIFAVEVAHSLTRAERKNLLRLGQAQIKLADVLLFAPVLHPHLSLLPRAVELSSQLRIGVYDCLYLALAEQEQCSVVTADQRLINSGSNIAIVSLSSL